MGKCLVTGGCGFIGSHLVDALLSMGHQVTVIDNLAVGRRANLSHQENNPNLQIIEGCVANRQLVASHIHKGSMVYHLAALADIVPSVNNPQEYFSANVDGTLSVLEACRAKEPGKLVYVASSSCYGIPSVYPTPESSPIDCRYPYALTKWMGEELVMHWGRLYGIPCVSMRFFNIYGPRARTSGTYGAVFGVFLAQKLAGKPLTIVGDGTQTRDFTYVSDAVSSLITAAESNVTCEIFNVGSDKSVSIHKLVELLDTKDKIFIPKRPGEPDCTFADTSKIKRLLNWSAKVSIETGVQRMLETISLWNDAPVWTPETIETATEDWFRFLDK